MIWKNEKPTVPGYYANRLTSSSSPSRVLAKVKIVDGVVYVGFNAGKYDPIYGESDEEYFRPMEKVLARQWFRIPVLFGDL